MEESTVYMFTQCFAFFIGGRNITAGICHTKHGGVFDEQKRNPVQETKR
jgi:hypothetical protein